MEENLLPAISCLGALREKMEQQTTISNVDKENRGKDDEKETQRTVGKGPPVGSMNKT